MMTEEQAKSLLLKQENVYTRDPQLREPAFAYCEGYKAFLNAAKTEREAVEWAVREAEANGFVPYDPTVSCKPGDRVYRVNRGKSVMLAVIWSSTFCFKKIRNLQNLLPRVSLQGSDPRR